MTVLTVKYIFKTYNKRYQFEEDKVVRIKLTTLDCLRCGHNWVPKKTEVRLCPKCKSPYWDKPRKITKQVASVISTSTSAEIKKAVDRTFDEYGEVIKKLGRE